MKWRQLIQRMNHVLEKGKIAELKSILKEVADEHNVEIIDFKMTEFMGCRSLKACVRCDVKVIVDMNFMLAEKLSEEGMEHLLRFDVVGMFEFKD